MKGKLFDLSRFCLDDGPGIRTTVFFKGCPLHCGWCHNPEGKSGNVQILYDEKCVRCGACMAVCPTGSRTEKGIQRNLCKGCGKCASVCKYGALRLAGYEMDAERIVEICVQDKIYYQKSGGE